MRSSLKYITFALLLQMMIYSLLSCGSSEQIYETDRITSPDQFLMVLGIAQDAGYPQAQCKKSCCTEVWANYGKRAWVSCLAYIDLVGKQYYLFDASPDIKDQMHYVESQYDVSLAGIFISHAHMGHYTGLMHFGKEAIGAKAIPIYVMPRMKSYLEENGPWSQLVQLKNVELRSLAADAVLELSSNMRVTPFLVPHRDEFSETVGYEISSAERKAIFIPDIDKWHKWDRSIVEEVAKVDIAFLDGTFYRNGEIFGRDMSQIPHPFIEESMQAFESSGPGLKLKIHFIHLNHTNPALQSESEASLTIKQKNFNVARRGFLYPM